MDQPGPSPAAQPPDEHSPMTLAGCWRGVRMIVSILPGVILFGMTFGAAAFAKGLSLTMAVLMSAAVYAGLSQMVALEFWREDWSLVALAGLALTTAAINGRMILQGASLQPWLATRSMAFNLPHLFLLTDANWIAGVRYREGGGRDLGIIIGAGLAMWMVWVIATIPGYLAGSLVSDARSFALDLIMPIYFTAMLVPMWKGRQNLWPWLVAGGVALICARLTDGYAYIVIGALCGALTGAFTSDE